MKRATGTAAFNRRLIFVCGVIPALIAACLAIYRPPSVTASLDNATYDTLLRIVPTKPPDPRVAIVDVDEQSLASFGQWPWRRELMGRLIGRLRELGASIVALDVIFAEVDGHDAVMVSEARATTEVHPTSDDLLAGVLREGHVVLGYAFTFDGVRTERGCVSHPLGLAVIQPAEESGDAPFFKATGAICNLPMLSEAAGASGFLNAAPDADGILRRVPLLVELDGRVYPGLALAAVVGRHQAPGRCASRDRT